MNVLEGQVEQIVREVLARLNAPSSSPADAQTAATPAAAETVALELSKRVVSLADVAGKLDRVGQLVVPRGAVITPAVRDLLRLQKVDITYRVAEKARRNIASTVCVGQTDSRFDAARLLSGLRKSGFEVEQIVNGGLAAVVEDLAAQVRLNGRLSLLITHEPVAASCLANRFRGVRAAPASSPAAAREVVGSVGANFLIIDPKGRSHFEVQRIASAFCLAGPRQCPPGLQAQLA